MRVYRLTTRYGTPDPVRGTPQVFRSLGGCVGGEPRWFLDAFRGKPLARRWRPVRYWLDRPLLPRPDFFLHGGFLICGDRATTLAADALEMSGESFPVEVENEPGPWHLYHVTNCINALDPDRSTWSYEGRNREFRYLDKPAFHPDRFGEESLFKIPEDHGLHTYCLERTGDPDDGEFKALAERNALTGLDFVRVWESDGSPVAPAQLP